MTVTELFEFVCMALDDVMQLLDRPLDLGTLRSARSGIDRRLRYDAIGDGGDPHTASRPTVDFLGAGGL